MPVTSRVPQVSVLDLILYLVSINDLPDEVSSQVRLFVDDTTLYLTIESDDDSSAVQTYLDILSVWETRWDIELNPSKCQVINMSGYKNTVKTDNAFTWIGFGVCSICEVSQG